MLNLLIFPPSSLSMVTYVVVRVSMTPAIVRTPLPCVGQQWVSGVDTGGAVPGLPGVLPLQMAPCRMPYQAPTPFTGDSLFVITCSSQDYSNLLLQPKLRRRYYPHYLLCWVTDGINCDK